VPAGATRCEDCSRAFITCPNPVIRAAFATEPGVESWALVALATDGDATVASSARSRIDVRGGMEAVRAEAMAGRNQGAVATGTSTPWDDHEDQTADFFGVVAPGPATYPSLPPVLTPLAIQTPGTTSSDAHETIPAPHAGQHED